MAHAYNRLDPDLGVIGWLVAASWDWDFFFHFQEVGAGHVF